MATTTIHKLNYQLLVDSKKFEKGMTASRSELNMAKREMRAMLTPAQKMEVSLAKLGKLAEKDARFQGVYNQKLAEYKKHMQNASVAAKNHGQALSSMKQTIVAAAGAYLSFNAVMSAGRGIVNSIGQMDRLGKAARNAGVEIQFMTQLAFVTGRSSGFTSEQTISALEKMQKNIGDAVRGSGEAKRIFDAWGVSAQRLAKSGPEKAFEEIRKHINAIETDSERVSVSQAIFGRSAGGIASTMALTTDEFGRQVKLGEQLGKVMTENQRIAAEAAQDQIDDIKSQFDLLKKNAALAAMPAISATSGVLAGFNNMAAKEGAGMAALNMMFENTDNKTFREGVLGREEMGLAMGGNVSMKELDRRLAEMKAGGAGGLSGIETAKRDKINAAADAKRWQSYRNNVFDAVSGSGQNLTKGINGIMATAARQASTASGFLANTQIRLNPQRQQAEQMAREITKTTTGPADSIAAGSGAAFKFLNQTTAVQSIEVELAKKADKDRVKTVSLLEQIRDLQSKNKWEQKEYEEEQI